MTGALAQCTGPVHKAPPGGGPCPCGAVTRVRAARRPRAVPPPHLSPADWLLRTLRDDLVSVHFRDPAQLPDQAAERLTAALKGLIAGVEAVTYEAQVRGHATRRAYHDPAADAALAALIATFRDRPGFREEWTA